MVSSLSICRGSVQSLGDSLNIIDNVWCLCRFLDSGGVYKLAFGPKAFIVVSDPVVVRHLLKVGQEPSPQSCMATCISAFSISFVHL